MQKKTGYLVALTILAFVILVVPGLVFIAEANAETAAAGANLRPLHPVHPWRPLPAPLQGLAAPFPAAPPPPLNSANWTAIGPAPQATTSPPSGDTNVSGRLTGIAVDPTNPNNIYVTPAGGGVWKTTNGGTAWTPLTDAQVTLSMGAIALAPSNPNQIYAGTGEANNAADSNYGRGILTSSNGGATWSLSTGPGGVFSNNRLTIAQISVHPAIANTAYAAVASGAFALNGTSNGGTGIYQTTDGGSTWTNMTQANGQDSINSWTAVVVDPNNPSIIYAALGPFFGNVASGVYRSTDGGSTWSLLSNAPFGSGIGRIALAVAPSANVTNSHVLYVAISSPSTYGLQYFGRSDNADAATPTFTNLTAGTPNFLDQQGWYDIVIGVDPANPAVVYASGVVNYSTNMQLVIRSINSGGSWSDISTVGGIMPHTDSHAMAFDSSSRMLLGTDGGIWRYDPAGLGSWTGLNGNLNTIQFEGIGLHPTNSAIAIGGSQDNGTALYTGSLIWAETDGGDGGFAKFSSTNGSRVYHQIPNASFGTNFFRRSDDGGNIWNTKTSSIDADVNNQNFYAPFVVDPGNGDRVLYGTNRVWETTSGGDIWTNISDVNTAGFNNAGKFVDAIGLAPSDVNTIYAATGGEFAASSQIFVTTNHGALWTEHDLGVAGRVNDLQVDPASAQIAYAVINTFNNPNGQVYKTINGGVNWTNITGNLPILPVWSLQIDHASGALYVGADDGVYVTINGGTTWSRFATGLPNAQVYQLELNTHLHILGAATHGRGMWEILVGTKYIPAINNLLLLN
jgi:photosystem II stability/assembly factor-like uncharacterized protein